MNIMIIIFASHKHDLELLFNIVLWKINPI